jgi:polar amino acid transport system substrate-binding protein
MEISLSRRALGLLGAAVLVLGAAACGDDDDSGDETSGSEGDAPAEEERGTLAVCSDTPYEPFEFEDPDTGEQTGFDIEIIREVADRMGDDIEVTDQPFEGIWLAPQAGTCDIVASAMTINPERAENALFSDPYFDAEQSLLVLAEDEETYGSLEDLAGETIGVQSGTTGETYANENKPDGATIRGFDDSSAMFLAIESGEVAALLQDLPVNGYRASQDESFVVVETYPTDEQYGFAAALDNTELIDQVNEQLAAMREDGTYDEIYEEWFGTAPAS